MRALAVVSISVAALLVPIAAEPSSLAGATCLGKRATKVGSSKNDTIPGTPRADVIVGLGGDDFIRGFGGNDLLCGGSGNDLLTGDEGSDKLSGGTGEDLFIPGTGRNTVLGNSGSDTVGFPLSLNPVTVDLAAGRASGEGADLLRGLENAVGSDFGDVLRGNADKNIFLPQAGDDRVDGRGGFDLAFFDAPVDANLATHLSIGEGRDALVGLEGLGGSEETLGSYRLTGDGADNVLLGGGGADVLNGGGGDDRVGGGIGNDALYGGSGDDILRGGPGDDQVVGNEGAQDSVSYLDAGAPVHIDLAAGTGTGEGTDAISGVEGASGSRFSDVLTGDGASNDLLGHQGNDLISGGPGADFLGGGGGTNNLNAGLGDDYCLSGKSGGCELTSLPGPVPGAPSKPRRTPSGLRPSAARSSRSFEYWAAPVCRASGNTYTTEISPPRSVQPVGTRGRDEFASWKATLYRYAPRARSWKKQKAFRWARAQIAGARVRGAPVWRSRSGAVVLKARVKVPAGRYAWVADLYWSTNQTTVRGWVEPHLVYAASGALSAYDNSCRFPLR